MTARQPQQIVAMWMEHGLLLLDRLDRSREGFRAVPLACARLAGERPYQRGRQKRHDIGPLAREGVVERTGGLSTPTTDYAFARGAASARWFRIGLSELDFDPGYEIVSRRDARQPCQADTGAAVSVQVNIVGDPCDLSPLIAEATTARQRESNGFSRFRRAQFETSVKSVPTARPEPP